jgi:hypothetical protein
MGEEERLQHSNRDLGFRCVTTWEETHGPPPYNYGLSIYERNKDNYPVQLSYFVAWILENNIYTYGSLKTIQVKEKKKGRHERIVSDLHGNPLVGVKEIKETQFGI